MSYIPKQQRELNEALNPNAEVKRPEQPKLTEEEIQRMQVDDAEKLLSDIESFTLQAPQKTAPRSEIAERAKLSQQITQSKQLRYVPLEEQKHKEMINQLHAKYEQLMDAFEREQIHVVREYFNDFHSKTVVTGYVATAEYGKGVIDSILKFTGYLVANQKLSILCQVLDEVKGFYYQQYPEIQRQTLEHVLDLLTDLVPTLPQYYVCNISENLLGTPLSESTAKPSDNLFIFILRAMHYLQETSASCYYPDVFCATVSRFMLVCVAFKRNSELLQVISEASQFSWQPQRYDDYSSVSVQKQVYALRCDMFCALISLRLFPECYDLFSATSELVRSDLSNEVVCLSDVYFELLEIINLTIKYFYLCKNRLFQAQAIYSYLRLALVFKQMENFQAYANEAIVLLSTLPDVQSAGFEPSFALQTSEDFFITEKVRKLTYDDLADGFCPFIDIYNLYEIKKGSPSRILAAVLSISSPPQTLLRFISDFLDFPKHEEDALAYVGLAKDKLAEISTEKYRRDVVTYADLVVMKTMQNAVVLFMADEISKTESFTIADVQEFCEKMHATYYAEDRKMLPCLQTRSQIIFEVVKLLSTDCFAGIRLDLGTMRFIYEQKDVLQSQEAYTKHQEKLNDLTADRTSDLSKFNKSVLYNRFYQLRPAQRPAAIDHAEQCLQIIKRKYAIAAEKQRIAAEQEEQERQFEKEQHETDAQLAAQAQERQRDQELRSIIQEVIEEYIEEVTAETDDQEMADYLNSIDLTNVPILKQHREICQRQQEFQRQRLQRKQEELAGVALEVEAQLWYFRGVRKAQRVVEFEEKAEELNQMLQNLVPVRYESEKAAYDNINLMRQELEEIGDYAAFLGTAEQITQERLAQKQHDYQETFKRTTEEIKQRHIDEIERVNLLKEEAEEEKAAEQKGLMETTTTAVSHAKTAKKEEAARSSANNASGGTGSYEPPNVRSGATKCGTTTTQNQSASSAFGRPKFHNSKQGDSESAYKPTTEPSSKLPPATIAAAEKEKTGNYVPPGGRK